jgi:hypothetical protein
MKDYAPKDYSAPFKLSKTEKLAAIGILLAWIGLGIIDAADPLTPREASQIGIHHG